MTIGAIARKTTHFLFNIINFDTARWHTYEHDNWDLLDTVLNGVVSDKGITGIWANNLDIAVGDKYIDPLDASVWVAVVEHVSAAAGNFSADRSAHPSYWVVDTLADLSVSTAKLQDGAVTLNKMGSIPSSTVLGRASPGTGAPEALTAAQVKALLGGFPLPSGQCKLSKSGSNLVLLPKYGNKITVNGVACSVPNAGVSLAPPSDTITMTIASPTDITKNAHGLIAGTPVKFATTGALPTGITAGRTYYVLSSGLAGNTFQIGTTPGGAAINTSGTQSGTHTIGLRRFIYATQSNGVVNALEHSATGHVTSTTTGNQGTEIKSGDDTRSLVGMAFDLGNGWVDTETQRLVRSWFNDNNPSLFVSVASAGLGVTTSVELALSYRLEFLLWGDGEKADTSFAGHTSNSTATNANTIVVSYNGPGARVVQSTTHISDNTFSYGLSSRDVNPLLPEGYNYATLYYTVSGGTASFNGGFTGRVGK